MIDFFSPVCYASVKLKNVKLWSTGMAAVVMIRDQAYIKYRNIQSVLTLLTEHQPISRTELARLAEMSPTSITRIIGILLSLNLVEEAEPSAGGGPGRRAINLHIRGDGLLTLGISLEPHRVALGLLDFENRLLLSRGKAIPEKPHTPEAMAYFAREVFDRIPRDALTDWSRLKGVGVCVAGTVDWETGVVSKSDQMRWENARVGEAFADAFGLPTHVENDVKACLTGEMAHRSIPAREVAAYLMIGTGVGVAATASGRLLRGMRNGAGEIDGIPAAGGGLLQDHLVEASLIRRAQRVEPRAKTLDDILLAYRQDVGWARMLMGDFLRCLRNVIAMVSGFFDPHLIILGGSIVPKVSALLSSEPFGPQVVIGENYGDACITGAAIIAQRIAVERLIELDG